ncbi:MAG: hypothetical protein HRT88_13510, partial [Lentisphaeraceae bacterium]|nr:hypothetical protein [Lentisphaeraceae bacterium]
IELETNPLEVLKMGTYVGSCYGLGGMYAHSAAAVALDINKQVLYLRDEKGKVHGRQLLVIDTSGKLVCFEVYPSAVSEEVRAHFAAYNIAFSDELNCQVYEGEDDDAEIDFLISEWWYQDYSWNPHKSTNEK